MCLNKILVASNNQKKLKELSTILKELGYECVSLKDVGAYSDPEETGKTFSENAKIKASAGMNATGLPCIADDSGLCCMALGGAPGVYSARYCDGTDEDRTRYLLKNMENETCRDAYFASAICLALPNGDFVESYGECHGQILKNPTGSGGFGYDPVFYVPEMAETFSEMSQDKKNKISHRANALKTFAPKFKEYMRDK